MVRVFVIVCLIIFDFLVIRGYIRRDSGIKLVARGRMKFWFVGYRDYVFENNFC